MADFRLERADFSQGKADIRPKRADLKLETRFQASVVWIGASSLEGDG